MGVVALVVLIIVYLVLPKWVFLVLVAAAIGFGYWKCIYLKSYPDFNAILDR